MRRGLRGDRPADRPAATSTRWRRSRRPGALGFAGNWVAALIRSSAGRRLDSPALIADGDHARADAYVSLAVVASAAALALGVHVADPLIGLGITVVILRITLRSWRTVRSRLSGVGATAVSARSSYATRTRNALAGRQRFR